MVNKNVWFKTNLISLRQIPIPFTSIACENCGILCINTHFYSRENAQSL